MALGLPASPLLSPGRVTDETRPFWEATSKGQILVQRCETCSKVVFPPLPSCPTCGHSPLGWEAARGTPELYSWVIVNRSTHPEIPAPYAVALAEFDGGVRIPGNLLYDETSTPHVGAQLIVDFHEVHGGVNVPVFRIRST